MSSTLIVKGILYIQVRPRVFFAVLVRSQIFAVLARSMTVPKVDHGRTISKHCSHIHIWHGHIHIWYGLGRHDLTFSNANPMCPIVLKAETEKAS